MSNRCIKCGTTNKSGERSCCASGGAWFKNCGHAGDAQFDHTWADGFQACKDFASSVQSPVQIILGHGGEIAHPMNATQPRNTAQQQTNIYRSDSMTTPGIMVSKDYVGFAKVVGIVYISFIILHL